MIKMVFLRLCNISSWKSESKVTAEVGDEDGAVYKVFNDPVHGHIRLHPVCAAIINTPQFHRLRDVKQLGAGYYVYPGASHNRFEHSIGVCHLAGKMVKALRKRLPKELSITDKETLCVQIAGLCHDMGHGPFSHVFDAMFIPKVLPISKWKHEDASVDMFDDMCKDSKNRKLQVLLKKYDLTDKDFKFIKEQINGKGYGENNGYCGRPEKKFLYEIVSNKATGIDVDKFDYFVRDCYYLGMRSSFQLERFFQFAKVLKYNETGEYHICFRDKEAFNVYLLFFTRYIIHRRACFHKTVKIIEMMLVDAMAEVKDKLKIPCNNGEPVPLLECIEPHNTRAYVNLTDSVIFNEIFKLKKTDTNVEKAQQILRNIQTRDLYQLVAESEPIVGKKSTEDEKLELQRTLLKHLGKEDIVSSEPKLTEKEEKELENSNVSVQDVQFDFGKKDKNPVHNVFFYNKDNDVFQGDAKEVSCLFPRDHFKETLFRVILKASDKDDERIKQLKGGFDKWQKKMKT